MRKQQNTINLYQDQNIYSIKQVISITDEEDLNQFWDYLDSKKYTNNKYINKYLELFYNFTYTYIMNEDSKFFEVILEENDTNIYFTVWNKDVAILLNSYFMDSSMLYKYKNKKITINLNKHVTKKQITNISKEFNSINKKIISSIPIPIQCSIESKPILKQNFMIQDDLNELISLNEKLQILLYITKQNGINSSTFITLRSTISMFDLTIKYYDQIKKFSHTINEFSIFLMHNTKKFLEINEKEFLILEHFINNIDLWVHKLFIEGGEYLNFMDRSIKNDFEQIKQMITKK